VTQHNMGNVKHWHCVVSVILRVLFSSDMTDYLCDLSDVIYLSSMETGQLYGRDCMNHWETELIFICKGLL